MIVCCFTLLLCSLKIKMKSLTKTFHIFSFAIGSIVRAENYKSSSNDVPTQHKMTPNPNPYQVTYDDGTKSPFLRLKARGDIGESVSFQAYEETLDGFTVKQVNGKYVYLDVNDNTGEYIQTNLVAGVNDPSSAGIRKGAASRVQTKKSKLNDVKEPTSFNIFNRKLQGEEKDQHHRRTGITSGTLKNLVVPFRFSDHTDRTLPTRANLETLMNNNGPNALCPTGSVRDVYLENSFNQLDLQSTVIDWVTIKYSESYCAGGTSAGTKTIFPCLMDALNKAVAQGVNFGDYDLDNNGYIDGITFFHSGYAAEFGGFDAYGTNYFNRIWSHKWEIYTTNWSSNGVRVFEYHINPAVWDTSGSSIGRIGVVAHETGHFLGLPDLYDYGDDTYGVGEGIGSYGLMANLWGFSEDQYSFPLMSAWSKYKLGWVSPTVVSASGSFSLGQACDNADMIMISRGFPSGEYLLIENRQPCGFEAAMPQGGLAIFHIDDNANNIRGYPGQSGWPGNGNHYEVALLQADGQYDMEEGYNRGDSGDLFHAGGVSSIGPDGTSSGATYPNTKAYQSGTIINTGVTVSNISSASSTMTFDISIPGSPTASPTVTPPSPSPTPRAPTNAFCGDNVCQVNEGEGCGSCASDCFSPTHCFSITSPWQNGFYGPETYGMVFDVEVATDLYFYEIEVVLMANVNTQVTVYMKSSSYTSDSNLNNWDVVYSDSVSNGSSTLSYSSLNFDSRFYAAAGSTAAFYISYTSIAAFVFAGTGDFSNSDVTVKSGNILLQQTGTTLPSAYYFGYDFADTIKYDYAPSSTPSPTPSPSRPPTSAPTSSPTRAPTRSPTSFPTRALTSSPTPSPTSSPSSTPSRAKSRAPTPKPTGFPTPAPAPVSTPTTPITPSPTSSPTSSPTAPTPTPSCKDSTLRLKIPWNGGRVTRSCTWVAKKQTLVRCAVDGVAQACRETCGTCSICEDSTLRLRIPWNGKNVARYCTWVANKQTLIRCAVDGVADACPQTCGVC